ncbi:MAG TPA: hypothetical protein VD907_05720 [Verrucomicrobiae bacterium]|nr:hypothetical protein [Verrucomicrobiae bacterium]
MKQPLSFPSRLLMGLCAMSLGIFVTLITVQLTVLQRENVKTWLEKGNAYQNITDSTIGIRQDIHTRFGALNPGLLQPVDEALDKTFSTQNTQKQTEQAIDAAYDWLEGKTTTPPATATLDVQQQAFIRQLVPELQSQLAQLPNCPSGTGLPINFNNLQCRPIGPTDQQLAEEIATKNVELSDAFHSPSAVSIDTALMVNRVPALVQALPTVAGGALLVAVLSGIGVVFLSRERHLALRKLAVRIGVSMLVTALFGAALLLVGTFLDFGFLFVGLPATTTAFFAPLTEQALPAIGTQLLVLSGSLIVVALLLYGGSRLWQRALGFSDATF